MRAGVRDLVFLAVIVGSTGIMGAGLVHSSRSPSANRQSHWQPGRIFGRSSRRWMVHSERVGLASIWFRPRRRRSSP